MEKESENTNNSKPIANDVLIGPVRIDELTGEKYNATRKVKCKCKCHEPNSNMIHCFPCCHKGYDEERIFIDL
jgi:hypothetical protein